jgi:hypothetical protein
MVEATDTLASLQGRVLGDASVGRASVTVTMTGTDPDVGTLEMLATSGKIEKFSIGGVQLFFDDFCLEE